MAQAFPTIEPAEAVVLADFGRWIWSVWYTAMGAALQITHPSPAEYDYPALGTLGEGEGLSEALIFMAAGLAIIGDWDALDELAAAAAQTFLQFQDPAFAD